MASSQLPIPASGQVRVKQTGRDTFELECSEVNQSDHDKLIGFCLSMHGRLGEFEFECGEKVYPRCSLDTDSPSFQRDSRSNRYSVRLPIRISK
jgi:hypothetical protein